MMTIHCLGEESYIVCNAYHGVHAVVHTVEKKEFLLKLKNSQERHYLCRRCQKIVEKQKMSSFLDSETQTTVKKPEA